MVWRHRHPGGARSLLCRRCARAQVRVAKAWFTRKYKIAPVLHGSLMLPGCSSTLTPRERACRAPAGSVTPLKVSQLAALLHLPSKRVEALLAESLEFRQLSVADVQAKALALSEALCLPPKSTLYMLLKQPKYLLPTPAAEVAARAQFLADCLGVPLQAVAKASETVPSILKRDPDTIVSRVQKCADMLGLSIFDALHVAARAPEFLTDSPGVIKKRLLAINQITRQHPRVIARMVARQPDVVFMSPRILNNKINALMAILRKEKR